MLERLEVILPFMLFFSEKKNNQLIFLNVQEMQMIMAMSVNTHVRSTPCSFAPLARSKREVVFPLLLFFK